MKLLLLLAVGVGGWTVPLSGSGWTLRSENERVENVSVPGDVYSALFQAKAIPDPYQGDNDVRLRYVAEKDWSYETHFDLSVAQADSPLAFLRFEGLDTVASVFLNGFKVGSTDNMFREYLLNPKGHLRAGANQLEIAFRSPITYAKEASEMFYRDYNYSVPPDCPPALQHPSCHSNFIRKMQSSFSWDWGPAFPTMGPWRDVSLLLGRSLILQSLTAIPRLDGNWTLGVRARVFAAEDVGANLSLVLRGLESWNRSVELSSGWNDLRLTLPLSDSGKVARWWPAGYGEQRLYSFFAVFTTLHAVFPAEEESVQSEVLQLGFRTIRLNQDQVVPGDESKGRNFLLEVNDVPVFLKGTNWIPADAFQSRVGKGRLNFLFHSMGAAGMNGLRVWGGGVYESRAFYDLADRFGILVWQDFMFAVALYPAEPRFLATVAAEVGDVVRRIGHHASVAIWAGNNENELGLQGGWYHADHMADHQQYKSDYLKLYNETVWGAVNASDGSRPFVLSSPSNGIETLREGGISTNAGSWIYGDVHYYNYAANAWDPGLLPISRCVTEFGYQSLPSWWSLVRDVGPTGLAYWSKSLMHRQHHPGGNLEMLASVLAHFPLPRCEESSEWLRGPGTFHLQTFTSFDSLCQTPFALDEDEASNEEQFLRDMIYLTQIHQAMAYKTQIEHYRRWQNRTTTMGMGNTMCALYWQLNDIWVAPSWATIDYYGHWKAAQYYVKRAFSPVLVSPYQEKGTLKVGLINDGDEELEGGVLLLHLFSFEVGREALAGLHVQLDPVPPHSARLVYEGSLAALGAPDPANVLVTLDLQAANGTVIPDAGNILLPDNFHSIAPVLFAEVKVEKVWVEAKGRLGVRLVPQGALIAPLVWLEVEEDGLSLHPDRPLGHFDRNVFTILRDHADVFFTLWHYNGTLTDFQRRLRVTTLRHLFHPPKHNRTRP